MFILRKAAGSDIPYMQVFIFEHGKSPWNYLPEEEVKAHIADITAGKVQAYIAEDEGACVGFTCFCKDLPHSCKKYENEIEDVAYLSEIVVHRNYAGQGIGARLIDAVKNELIAQGIKKLYAERHADNAGSAGVMAKTGFKIVDEYADAKRRSEGSKKTVVTCLVLQP